MAMATQPYFDGRVSDTLIVPVSISYHERMENMLYVGELPVALCVFFSRHTPLLCV